MEANQNPDLTVSSHRCFYRPLSHDVAFSLESHADVRSKKNHPGSRFRLRRREFVLRNLW